MKKQQAGFTLIELVVVIVLLGILGAAATARFQNLAVQAGNAAAQGTAAEVSSSAAINFAAAQLGTAGTTNTAGGSAACAATSDALLQAGAVPGDITVTAGAGACVAAGDTFTCNVAHDDGDTAAVATIICTGP